MLHLALAAFAGVASAAYDSSYVYARVRDESSGEESRFCANYQQFHKQNAKIAESPSEATELRLFFPASGPRGQPSFNLCNASKSLPLRLPPKSVGVSSYRLRKDTPDCPSKHLNLSQELEWAVEQQKGAAALLFLLRRGQEYLRYNGRPVKDLLFWEFRDGLINDSQLSTPIFFAYERVFEDKALSLAPTKELHVAFYRPKDLILDPAMAILLVLATGAVWVGGWWSGRVQEALLEDERRRRSGLKSLGGGGGVGGGTEEAEMEEDCPVPSSRASTPEPATAPFTWLSVAFFVLVIVGMLLLLYYFYEYFVWFIIVMYTLAGATAMTECLTALCEATLGEKFGCRFAGSVEDVWESWTGRRLCCRLLRQRWRIRNFLIYLGALSLCISWLILRNRPFAFLGQDVISIFFSINLIKSIRLPNLKYITCLLSLLLVYDLFMVFITPYMTKNGCSIMVEVATGSSYCRGSSDKAGEAEKGPPGHPIQPQSSGREQLPILLIVPRLGDPMLDCYDLSVSGRLPSTMLGLGDIILPGLLVGFAFGADRSLELPCGVYGPFGVASYALGLIATFLALYLTEIAQPALIYLVPSTLLTTFAVAAVRGEVCKLWRGPGEEAAPEEQRPPLTDYASIQANNSAPSQP